MPTPAVECLPADDVDDVEPCEVVNPTVPARELIGDVQAEQHREVHPAVCDVCCGRTEARVRPIDDSRDTALRPQDVAGMKVAVAQHPRVPRNRGAHNLERTLPHVGSTRLWWRIADALETPRPVRAERRGSRLDRHRMHLVQRGYQTVEERI